MKQILSHHSSIQVVTAIGDSVTMCVHIYIYIFFFINTGGEYPSYFFRGSINYNITKANYL